MPADAHAYSARLFPSEGPSRPVALSELAGLDVGDESLLWIDLQDDDAQTLEAVWDACRLPEAARAFLDRGTSPEAVQQGEFFWIRCVVADNDSADKQNIKGQVLACVAGRNRVVSVHAQPIAFLTGLRQIHDGDAPVGSLCAESFVATLLDRQLATYFEAVSDFEAAIERLEGKMLHAPPHDALPELQRLRRWASRLRRMLAPHRSVFGVISRPDFRPNESRSADKHFVALDTRFERAMDMVENARELVMGSFDLFTSQTALRTNDTMRVLTFVTVITGLLATLVGALGMNFDASFFKTQDAGFWVAVAGLVCVCVAALVLGRWRRWF